MRSDFITQEPFYASIQT